MDPVTMLILSGLGSAFGMAKSAQQNQKNDAFLAKMVGENKAEYNKEYNTPYSSTEEYKSAIRQMLEQIKSSTNNAKSSGAITGASPEKAVALQGKLGESFQNATTGLAGKGTARKEMIKDRYMNRKSQLDQMIYGNMQQKSQNWNQFGQNAMQLGATGLMANSMGGDMIPEGSEWWKNLLKKKPTNGAYIPLEAQ